MIHVRALVLIGMVAMAGSTSTARQATVFPQPSRLTGIVLADDTGSPIPKASVRVLSVESRSAMTDEQGRFEIDNITPGSYLVTAVIAGYAMGTAGQRHPADTPTLLEFQPRGDRSIEIRLTALGAIVGTILDEKGQPVPSAEVVASRVQSREGCRECRAVTDRDGRYRLTGLRDGRYHVMAIAPPTRGAGATAARDVATTGLPGEPGPAAPSSVTPPTRPITYYPGAPLPAQSVAITVAAGRQVDASFPLVPSELTRIGGTILDSRGAPVRDYFVMLDAKPPQPRSLLPRMIEVGTDGRFELKDVPPGEYTLLVRDQERFVLIAQTGGTIGQGFKGELADLQILVPGDGLDDLRIVTRPGYELSGTVILNGQPLRDLKGGTIAVAPAEFTTHPVSGASVRVEADGTFRMPNLSGANMVRAVNLPPGLMVQRISVGGVDVADYGVEMTQNITADVVVGPQTELRGRVTARRGTPVPGMSVVLFAQDPRRWTIPDTPFVRTIPAAADGSFRVSGLPAGRYYAAAVVRQLEGQQSTVDDLDLLIARASQFELANSEQKVIAVRID